MVNNINSFVNGVQLDMMNSLTHLLNTAESEELNAIQHSPYFGDDVHDKYTFSIVSLNCQSLHAKFDYIKVFVDKFINNNTPIQVLCLQESWFSTDTDLSLYKIPGYHMILTGHYASNHGGLVIYLHNKWDYVLKSLKEIKLGKSAGIDGLAAEHFVYSHSSISVHLALLFTCMLNHGHVPTAFMKTSIIPILKNRNGDSSDKNNYRPIAIVTAMSKLFELCLSKLLDTFLVTSDNQFGFKRKHATDLCIYTVKSVIKYYNYFSSPVYTCFLDASKAFDRVNHWTLFKKLLIKGVPVILVRILCIWYRCQQLCIQWGKTKSSFFTISNGVRQGGILSPKLFSVYMDDLSNMLIRKIKIRKALVVILIMYVSIMCFMQTTYV